MPDELTIRRYEPADAEVVWEIHERALRASPITFVENVPGDDDLRAISDEYLDAGGEFLVGVTDGEVVAIGGYQPTEDGGADGEATAVDTDDGADDEAENKEAAEIRRMRVHPDHQRRGYGEELLTRLETLADERGFDRIVLETNENLRAARTLYETHGYEQYEAESHPVTGEDIVRYRKEL
jgi:ribosomal protein S18 acetylase RimI-like enzyme